jgi:hypothetical protein
LNGTVESYLNRVADSRKAGTSDADLVDSLAAAFKSLAGKVSPEIDKLVRLQELLK